MVKYVSMVNGNGNYHYGNFCLKLLLFYLFCLDCLGRALWTGPENYDALVRIIQAGTVQYKPVYLLIVFRVSEPRMVLCGSRSRSASSSIWIQIQILDPGAKKQTR